MKNLFAGLFVSLFFCATVKAQNFEPINSGALISKGIKLHDEKKYKDAIGLYRQVAQNDTNYTLALYEMAYSLSADSNFTDAIAACREGLAQDNKNYEMEFMLLHGNIVDDLGKTDEAIRIYDSALLKYPNAPNVLLNKSVSLIRAEKIDAAEAILKEMLIRNPFYASAHYKLGQCELKKGQVVPAMMCFYTYLINSPGGTYSSPVINQLGSLAKGSDDLTSAIEKRTEQPLDNFAQVEQILLSRIALDKNYKLLTGLDDPITRQLQVMMEKLRYDSKSEDFFMQYYVPYIKDIFEKKLFEPAVYHAFSDVNLEIIQRYVKKNSKEINEALQVIASNLQTIGTTRELNYNKRKTLAPIYHFDDAVLYGKGSLVDDKATGNWEFYYKTGNLRSKGSYTAAGKKNGKWTYYYEDGTLSGVDNWIDGEQQGEDLVYNRHGILLTKANYLNGKLNGPKTSYFGIGQTYSIADYKDGKETGKYIEFYGSGRKKIEAETADDQLQGSYKSYYTNGQLEVTTTYEKGKLHGSYKSYHDNGKPLFEGNYKNGDLDGPTMSYHSNGELSRKVSYINGQPEGEQIEYNDEGVITQKLTFKKGKTDGLAQYFDDDGKLYSTFLFDNDRLKEARYFDKEGKLISVSERKNKKIELTNFNAEGFKTAIEVYNDQGQKQGTDTLFYTSGKIKEINSYKDGMLEGTTIGYFPNGAKEYEISFEKDKKQGFMRNYFLNGQLKSTGWYDAGDPSGDWIEYNEKGKVVSTYTYLNNDLYGKSRTYFADGRVDDETAYYSGWVASLQQYDTASRKIYTSELKNGAGVYKSIYPNGKTRYEGAYANGELNGRFVSYFFDGTVQVSKNYNLGLLDGDYTENYYGGKLAAQGKYNLGKKVGTWKYFYPSGQASRQEEFVDGEQNGKAIFYFPDGKPEREVDFRNDMRNGIFKRYSSTGELGYIMYYKDDVPTGYTYNDKNGQPVAVIPIKGGNGKVKSFYSNGNPSAEMEFSDGKLNGKYVLYYPNGKLYYQEEKNEYGMTVGKTTEYYPNGQVNTAYNYYYENQDGPAVEYYENGKLKEEANYYNGYLNGPKKLYDNTGRLIETRFYFYGLLLNVIK